MRNAWAQAPGKIIATAVVFIVLIAIAVPTRINSSREKENRKVIRYLMSFQAASARYQNDSPSLRFFADTTEAKREGYPHEDNDLGYNFIYMTDKSRTKFCYLAVPDANNSATKTFLADETGRIYTCNVDGKMRDNLAADIIPNEINFNLDPEKRIPGDWLPL